MGQGGPLATARPGHRDPIAAGAIVAQRNMAAAPAPAKSTEADSRRRIEVRIRVGGIRHDLEAALPADLEGSTDLVVVCLSTEAGPHPKTDLRY
jgi:hypothetical protein